MDFNIEKIDSKTVLVALPDRLDSLTAQEFRTAMDHHLSDGANQFIVDLSDTPFLDSAGMATLVSLLKRSRQENGDVKLVWPKNEPVVRILQLTRFDRVFEIYETPEAALTSTPGVNIASS